MSYYSLDEEIQDAKAECLAIHREVEEALRKWQVTLRLHGTRDPDLQKFAKVFRRAYGINLLLDHYNLHDWWNDEKPWDRDP